MAKSRIFQIFLILTILAVTSLVAGHRALSGSSDFDTYYYAGKAILEGLPLYTISQHSVNLSQSPFVYPPFFAFFITPFSILPIYFAAAAWNAFSLFSFLAALFLMGRMMNLTFYPDQKNIVWGIIFIVLSAAVLIDNLVMGQVNCFVFFLAIFGIYLLEKARDFWSGFWIGVAACIKLFPAIFFPYFLIRRKWSALLGGLAAALVCICLVPGASFGISKTIELHRQWIDETIRPHMMPKTLAFYSNQLNPSHQDLKAVVFRWVIDWRHREATGGPHGREFFFRLPYGLSEKQSGTAGNAAVGFIFLSFIFIMIKNGRMKDKESFLYTVSLILTTMVLVSPKARSHFFVFLTFPWLVLVNQISVCAKNRKTEKRFLLTSAVFYFAQAVKYFKFLGFGAFSALTLWIYFTYKLAKGKNDQQ